MGNNASTGIAQKGIFWRLCAAATHGATGSGAAGVLSTMAGEGAADVAAALEAAGTTASEPELAALLSLGAASPPPPIAARRARLLAKRCSGTSVNPASAALGC
ncbi:unannotated protein [freshwater metagenome]|uniref:Unannotated protein n=1 Tax=freshwater metagenome TaxID=449393 RepID=A0A6J6TVP5_9ZZZZ